MTTITKPLTDNRKYKHLQLDNGMNVTLVSDPKNKVASACVIVKVGHYQDPDDFNGLAHFLEHMLFMGSTNYPKENHYFNFINDHGGSSNAYTAKERTCYFFDVMAEYFEEALQIFSRFFIDPLLKEDAVNREINAVNSEHSKNINSDPWRLNGVIRELVQKGHPQSKFGTGNLETLQKPGLYAALRQFHDKYYAANMMNLVVYWNQPVGEMAELAKRLFSAVPNHPVEVPRGDGNPFPQRDSYLKARLIPVAKTNMVSIVWPIRNTHEYYRSDPVGYVLHLLDFEGGVPQELKNRQWVNNVMCYVMDEDDGFEYVTINATLTDEGLANVDDVVSVIEDYLHTVRQKGIEEWMFEEHGQINQLNFDYMDKTRPIDYVVTLGNNMFRYPAEDYIRGPYRCDQYDPQVMSHVLDQMIPSNGIILVSSQQFTSQELQRREKWYGVIYDVEEADNRPVFTDSSEEHRHLSLPDKNPYIPQSLEVIPGVTAPVQLIDINRNLWYQLDTKFKNPWIIFGAVISNDYVGKSTKNIVACDLWVSVLADRLSVASYYAGLCNSYYSLRIGSDKLILTFEAYSDCILRLMQQVVGMMQKINVTQRDFNLVKSKYETSIYQLLNAAPHSQASELLNEKIIKGYHSLKAIQKAFREITIEDVQKVGSNLLDACQIQYLVQGNVTPEGAQELIEQLSPFQSKRDCVDNLELMPLEPGRGLRYVRKPHNESEDNIAVHMFFEVDIIKKGITPDWETLMALLMLTELVAKEKFFNELRTKRQTGYIVRTFTSAFSSKVDTLYGLSFVIQTGAFDRKEVEKRMMHFVKNHLSHYIRGLSENKFHKYVATLIKQLMVDPTNLAEEFEINFGEIMKNSYMFDYKKTLIERLRVLELSELQEFYQQYFGTQHKLRISVISA